MAATPAFDVARLSGEDRRLDVDELLNFFTWATDEGELYVYCVFCYYFLPVTLVEFLG